MSPVLQRRNLKLREGSSLAPGRIRGGANMSTGCRIFGLFTAPRSAGPIGLWGAASS